MKRRVQVFHHHQLSFYNYMFTRKPVATEIIYLQDSEDSDDLRGSMINPIHEEEETVGRDGRMEG